LNPRTSVIPIEDKELILTRAQKGDAEALNLLFESCRSRLFSSALRIVHRPQDAEDAVQDAMLAAFKHLDQFQGRSAFVTWATRIVINAALVQLRRARSKPVISRGQFSDEFEELSRSESIKDPQQTPEEIYQGAEHKRLLEEALQNLPERHRRAIQLCTLEDLSLKGAASTFGVPLGTLKGHLHRARRSLFRTLQDKTRGRRQVSRNSKNSRANAEASQNLRAA
jgi:RNA polymerase sigma-70 factor (ECF subfamily)